MGPTRPGGCGGSLSPVLLSCPVSLGEGWESQALCGRRALPWQLIVSGVSHPRPCMCQRDSHPPREGTSLPHCLPLQGWEERAYELPPSWLIFLFLGSQTSWPSSCHLSEFFLAWLCVISRIYSSTLWGGAGRNESTHVAAMSGNHLP